MPETEQSHQDQDFVAPDELNRVVDPEKAEHMARASDEHRSIAALHRQKSKDLKDIGAFGSNFEESDARAYDGAAELIERFKGTEYDISEFVDTMIPPEQYPAVIAEINNRLTGMRSRIELVSNSPSKNSDAVMEKLGQLRDEETRLELMKQAIERKTK